MIAERIEAADPFGDAIKDLLTRNPEPFFVQVGGYDGVSFDPLRPHVVAENLSGIIVEPVPGYFAKLQALYAGSDRVRPVNCAVAEENGERVIWRFKPEAVESGLLPPHFGGISSFLMEDLLAETGVLGRSSPNAETTAILRTLVEAVPVQARSMATLLEEQGVTRVDILQVDTEGYDYRILQLFDFERFRPAIVHYEHQHLQPHDREAAERLLRGYGYRISADLYDTLAVLDGATDGSHIERLRSLATSLQAEGRGADALLILDHLVTVRPDASTLQALIGALSAEGRTLDALHRLAELRQVSEDPRAMIADIQAQAGPAMEKFNALLASGDVAQAEPYAAALAALAPGNPAALNAAMNCNLALGRTEMSALYAEALLKLDPEFVPARQAMAEVCRVRGDVEGEIGHRLFLALSPKNPTPPLLRLRDIHDVISMILWRPLTEVDQARLEALLMAASVLKIQTEPGSEEEAWLDHYRSLLSGVSLDAMRAPTPPEIADTDIEYADGTGRPLSAEDVRARADELGAQAVFFAAADEAYVDLYARWYVLSVLKHCDVSGLVVVHVIGGTGRLAQVAAKLGVDDPRLVFAATPFDVAKALQTNCYEAPPKGLMDKPVAHYQSVRFQQVGGLLRLLERPVFVSDIDLLLQRGVADLLARCATADVVLNENDKSPAAASRFTANLLLVRPTLPARAMMSWMRAYLDRVLSGREVSRWIDQLALLQAQYHLSFRVPQAKIAFFDTHSDINNIMYPSYQEHPFRFLSLFHGFDTSSLEGQAGVIGETAPAPKRSRKASKVQ